MITNTEGWWLYNTVKKDVNTLWETEVWSV